MKGNHNYSLQLLSHEDQFMLKEKHVLTAKVIDAGYI
jgi:hypothetical protein